MMTYEEYQNFLKEQFTAAGENYVKKTVNCMKESFLSSRD